MLGLLAFRIQVDAQFGVIANLVAHGMQVEFPPDVRARQQQFPGIVPVDIEVFPNRPLHEEARARIRIEIVGSLRARFVLLKPRQNVMHDLAPCGRAGTDLDRTHPPRFSDRNRGERLEPDVLAVRRHRVIIRLQY